MKVPFVDLHRQYLSIKDEIDHTVFEALSQSDFIGGDSVNTFEGNFVKKLGTSNCISVGNGTDSLYIILKMLGIKEGDEVITSALSWISSSETISQTGAKPIFCDIDPEYFTIDEDKIEPLINQNTKAIVVVHLYGQMCEMDSIINLCDKYNLYLIEDCAQAHFSTYKHKNAGTLGDAGSFSFYPGKNLGAYGDAGCIVTDNEDFAKKFRLYSKHGALIKHEHQIEGINSRLDSIQARILNVKLKYIDKWTEQRRMLADIYGEMLKDLDNITLPIIRENTSHSFHLYVIKTKKRDQLKEFLAKKGIATGIHYPKILPNLEAYKSKNYTVELVPNAQSIENTILSLPLFPELSFQEVEYVCECVKLFNE